MSAAILLKQTMARRNDGAFHPVKHCLMLAAIVLALGLARLNVADSMTSVTQNFTTSSALDEMNVQQDSSVQESTLSPVMTRALAYVAQRYRVSADALKPVFEAAQSIGQERRIDPLLIVAVIAIESRFNPFAESPMGAQGLMQIIPRFHMDKIPEGAGDRPFLDPAINIRIGVTVLEDAIRRRGGLTAGLQYYSGSSDPERAYAGRVLAEKARLEQAAQRRNPPSA